ncbi:acetyl-CoA carboxylase biotin carboxylase subunit family protein [Kitasatospora sp. NPDC088134]|uniref:ATP-grasp domain-containing protein n=1 Tax=Kitasatospora sp. NPDC088134 TaxID=3364071 RepID=UPI0038014F59
MAVRTARTGADPATDDAVADPAGVPTVLVLGTGRRQLCEYALLAMAEEALLVGLDTQLPSWQAPYMEDFATAAPDRAPLLAAARDLARRHRVAGVVVCDERLAEPAAELAEELGLSGPGAAAVRTVQDRWATRALLNDAGVGVRRARLVSGVAEAERAAAELGLPVVLTARHPRPGAEPVRAETSADVERAFLAAVGDFARQSGRPGGVLVETALDGPEFTLCCTVEEGRVRTWYAAGRERGRQYLVDATVDEPASGLAGFARRAHAALGIRHGVTHLDVQLAADGPVVLRAGCWLAGDLIPLAGCLATGVDLAAAGLRLALGRPARERVEYRRAAGIRLVLPADPAAADPGPARVVARPNATVVIRTVPCDEAENLLPAGELAGVALLAAGAADGPGGRAAPDAAEEGSVARPTTSAPAPVAVPTLVPVPALVPVFG